MADTTFTIAMGNGPGRSRVLRFRTILPVIASLLPWHPVLAQDGVFADDFSVDSIRYASTSFDDSTGEASAAGEPGAIRLRASSDGSGYASRYLSINEATDRLLIEAVLDEATDLTPNSGTRGYLQVESILYNDVADGGVSPVGNVNLSFAIGITGDGQGSSLVCLGRDGEVEFEPLDLFAGGNNCTSFDEIDITVGSTYRYGFEFDRSSGELTLRLDDAVRIVTLPAPIHRATEVRTGVQLFQDSGAGTAVARITSITTDSGTDDFAGVTPIVDRYRPFNGIDGVERSAEVRDDRARLAASSTDGNYNSTELEPAIATGYLEALLTLSSESDFAEGSVDTRLEADLYNDTADGGIDGRTGDVRAILWIRARSDGTRDAVYCLSRSNDAEFNASTGLLDEGSRDCIAFPLRIELDQAYRAAIALDRQAQSITFRLDGNEVAYPISTEIFDAAEPQADARASANESGSAVAYVDNLRTAPQALTASEVTAGATVPPAFPAAPDPASTTADSMLTNPFNFQQSVNFSDDFSEPSTDFGFWGGRDRGQSSVRYVDGAVEMAANSTDPDGNYTEFYVQGKTDGILARVSLSSESALPPDPDAEAEVRVQGVFHNDTQDGGFDGQAGDVYTSLGIRLRGDGRLTANFYVGRRMADGSNEALLIIDGEDSGEIDGFVPALDTEHALGIRVDRERGVLIYTADEYRREIQLPGQAFLPAQNSAIVQVHHRGSSGKAVARLHAVTTDTVDVDFALAPPLMGPYRPNFNTRLPGRNVIQVDGRLRLETDARETEGQDAQLIVLGKASTIATTLELSGESVIGAGSEASVSIGGLKYNDTADVADRSREGTVYAELLLSADDAGNRYVSYCAIRSNTDDFSDTIELIGGDTDNCPRMDLSVNMDTAYPASITLDKARSMLVYTFAGTRVDYPIGTGIFDPGEPFMGVNSRARLGSLSIGYADDLALGESPVPLDESDDRLVNPDGALSDDASGGGSSGSSGCSIAQAGVTDPLLAWLALVAVVSAWMRGFRRSR